ncbi:DNA-binding transcriptional LysR family regulator [Arthrobacter sp. JUb119]|uniref:LysR family transcriptional regulator n=1 Tax=Arthrobacter sp. JUb115 TaxID=2485108 RepID=UPI001060B944|nr:LysR family transcriptional regulator [Arthrobacter sp. JUb115]MCS3494513.1 DNA-binding transcriptional LysR family regulator [Arthrobacter sp. JUb119]TDU22603.1 LysR family transcriptional regulator [Arthrobacter sp. JUb115]
MLLSQLEYFVALARERHFGRAAAACFVSPSALSESIQKLEAELGAQLVNRGRNFQGLTGEGELALLWARRILSDQDSLLTDLSAAKGNLNAHIRIGAIPAGSSIGATVISELGKTHPSVTASLNTGLSSEEIVSKLRSFELEAGVILPSAADGPDLHEVAFGELSNVVIASTGIFSSDTKIIRGRMLNEVQLALLAPDMRARQQLDKRMLEHGIHLEPRLEVDSLESLLSLVACGPWAAVLPESAITEYPLNPNIRVFSLTDPHVTMPVAIVRLASRSAESLSEAIDDAVRSVLTSD